MNSLVTFRSNSEGNLLPNTKQREAASAEVVSTFKTKLMAAASNAAAAQAATTTAAKSAAASTATTKAASTATTTTKTSSGATTLSETDDAYQSLNASAFLSMLAVQLQNQDPTEPMDNAEMMAQLAQFSSLQQMTDMNENISQLNFLSAQSMLGKYVTGTNDDEEAISGIVSGVSLKDNALLLTVGGKTLPVTGVTDIALEAPSSSGTAT